MSCAGTALVLGASTYGYAFEISLPSVLQTSGTPANWVIYGLAVLGMFLVYR